MNKPRGFTLIELLVVITMIAVLTGWAVPYVQDYVDDSRIARCKSDLDDIRAALMKWEIQRREIYVSSNIGDLVGPYISKVINDPWGASYYVSNASSCCYSVGPDGKDNSGDEFYIDYRPRMAVTRIYWVDSNKDEFANTGDSILFVVTRPGSGTIGVSNISPIGLNPSWGGFFALGKWVGDRVVSFPLIGPKFPVCGSDTVSIDSFLTEIMDRSNSFEKRAMGDVVKIDLHP